MWGGGKGRKACTTNSAHERLLQQEQLSPIVSLHISSVPHLDFLCVSSKRVTERGELERKHCKPSGKHKPSVLSMHERGLVIFLFSGCVVDHGLIINCRLIKGLRVHVGVKGGGCGVGVKRSG